MRSRFNINNYSNLAQRVIAAIIGGSILIAGTIYDQWLYFAIFFVICMLAQLEFYKLVGLDGMLPLKTVGTILGCVIFTMSYLVELKHLPDSYYFLIFPLVSIIFFIKLYKKSDKKPFYKYCIYLSGNILCRDSVCFAQCSGIFCQWNISI